MLKTSSIAKLCVLAAIILYAAGVVQTGFGLYTMWAEKDYVGYALSFYLTPVGVGILIFLAGLTLHLMAAMCRYLGWLVQLKADTNEVDVPEFQLYLARLKKLRAVKAPQPARQAAPRPNPVRNPAALAASVTEAVLREAIPEQPGETRPEKQEK